MGTGYGGITCLAHGPNTVTLAEIKPDNSTCKHVDYYKLKQIIIWLLYKTYLCMGAKINE